MIIRNAALSLVVRDAGEAIANAVRVVEASRGYVAETKQWKESNQTRASAVLRVPSSALSPVLEQLRHVAIRVQSEAVTSQDVSQEHVDLAAQLRNLQATEVELRGLLTTVRQRTQKAADVLEVYAELTKVRSEIEKTQGRLEYLSQMTAYSTITLDVIPDALAAPLVEPGWQPLATVRSATRSMLGSLEVLTDAGIWLVIYVLPIALLFAGALLMLRSAWRVVSGRGVRTPVR